MVEFHSSVHRGKVDIIAETDANELKKLINKLEITVDLERTAAEVHDDSTQVGKITSYYFDKLSHLC